MGSDTSLQTLPQPGEVVVAQLVERSLPIPEVRRSNPAIGKNILILNNYCILSTVYEKTKNKEKEAGNGPFLKNNHNGLINQDLS